MKKFRFVLARSALSLSAKVQQQTCFMLLIHRVYLSNFSGDSLHFGESLSLPKRVNSLRLDIQLSAIALSFSGECRKNNL
jgi:hypothetical protein